jgi:hypothetical protein
MTWDLPMTNWTLAQAHDNIVDYSEHNAAIIFPCHSHVVAINVVLGCSASTNCRWS